MSSRHSSHRSERQRRHEPEPEPERRHRHEEPKLQGISKSGRDRADRAKALRTSLRNSFVDESISSLSEKYHDLKKEAKNLRKIVYQLNTSRESKIKIIRNLEKEKEEKVARLQQLEKDNSSLQIKLASRHQTQACIHESAQDLLDALKAETEDQFSCSICTEVMICVKTTNCGHSFCGDCLDNWLKRNHICPICRAKVKVSVPNLTIDGYIEKMFERYYDDEAKAARNAVKEERKQRTLLMPGSSRPRVESSDEDLGESFEGSDANADEDDWSDDIDGHEASGGADADGADANAEEDGWSDDNDGHNIIGGADADDDRGEEDEEYEFDDEEEVDRDGWEEDEDDNEVDRTSSSSSFSSEDDLGTYDF